MTNDVTFRRCPVDLEFLVMTFAKLNVGKRWGDDHGSPLGSEGRSRREAFAHLDYLNFGYSCCVSYLLSTFYMVLTDREYRSRCGMMQQRFGSDCRCRIDLVVGDGSDTPAKPKA